MFSPAHSSSGLGHRPLKAETTGSNPVCATTAPLLLRWIAAGRIAAGAPLRRPSNAVTTRQTSSTLFLRSAHEYRRLRETGAGYDGQVRSCPAAISGSNRAQLESVLNPFDEYAIEEAIRK